jgi:2-C-methyl-D-erythritol 4-phosphate cytidylyltransferase
MNTQKIALIVAGGAGTRMGATIPKQFILLNNKPILQHTIEKFYAYDPTIKIVVVLPLSQFEYWEMMCVKYNLSITHDLVRGGSTRFESVSNGLTFISDSGNAIVFVHDGVRPFVSTQVLENCYATALEKGNAIPAIHCNDSLRQVHTEGGNSHVHRADFRLIQTPQTFTLTQLLKAYRTNENPAFTDDASVVEYSGIAINLVQGNVDNIKITTPFDLTIGQAILSNNNINLKL